MFTVAGIDPGSDASCRAGGKLARGPSALEFIGAPISLVGDTHG
jgi:hypothetical protein